ncbi:MAG: methylenetetrahydrofolate reductase [Xanthobacteraceae bacterium]|nr:methylenetetrahydrofolate reductase [Xanthobacteraceae bacterium]
MRAPAVVTASPGDRHDPRAAIASFTGRFSLEATRPKPADVEALKAAVPAGTAVYLSAIPTRPLAELADAAKLVRSAGFEPVPHLAARAIPSVEALDGLLAATTREAGVRRVLVIGGDTDPAQGPFHGAVEVIESGLLSRHGVVEIGIAGHPDGHPRIGDHQLDRIILAKIEAAQAIGLKLHIVTQFCFDAAPILAWLARMRDLGVDAPVRVGLAGPTSLTALMGYARRCGVRASTGALARNAGLVKNLFGGTAPDAILRALVEKLGEAGDVAPHFFSFGGVPATARWAAAVAAGHIALDRTEGFSVEAR